MKQNIPAIATLQDVDAIVKINHLFHLNIDDFRWDTPHWVSEEIAKGNYYVLREVDLEVTGAICSHMLLSEMTCCIEAIAVRQDFQNRGVGRHLIDFVKTICRQQNISKICVESFCEYGLTDFYEACGFKKEASDGDYKGHRYNRFSLFL